MKIITGMVENSFTDEQLIHRSGLVVFLKYLRSIGLIGFNTEEVHALCVGSQDESENLIKQTRNQHHAGQTGSEDFHVNDILRPLAVSGDNLSEMIVDMTSANHFLGTGRMDCRENCVRLIKNILRKY